MNKNSKRVREWRAANKKPCICGTMIYKTSNYCRSCYPKQLAEDTTLENIKYDKHHKSSNWALVRWRARTACKDLPQICKCCGYDKHVEVCHIKPISSFSLDTMVSMVNSQDNLVLLCPNCHWEFDKGLLVIR